jgi:tRNA(Ile)-lysidine synthase TilS/MesJ
MPWKTEKDGKLYKFKPLIQFEKSELVDFARHHELRWIEDPTNVGESNDRAKLRKIMPEILAINPGLPKVIRKKYRS